ncbi:hypothetical protein DPEC_G00309330 [Dallia pectoralis]|uniref:Uncharacterized protein n=1 Tax=Dallia pectoralis TaxID=75939 RepID=A0ACC2FEX0_DALPE|nr:hypothetical protein DPEC_G00309330 [Dallia pectoralis]
MAMGFSRRYKHFRNYEYDSGKQESEDEEMDERKGETDTKFQNQPVVSVEEEDWEVEIKNSKLPYDPEDLLSPTLRPTHPSRVPSPWLVQAQYKYSPSQHHTLPVRWRCQLESATELTASTADQFEDAEED